MRLRIELFKTIKNKLRLFTQVLCFSFDRLTRLYSSTDSPGDISFQIDAIISISTDQKFSSYSMTHTHWNANDQKFHCSNAHGTAIYFDSDMIYIFRL